MKEIVMSFKTVERDRDELKTLSKVRDVSVSQIIRKSIRRELEEAVQRGEIIRENPYED